MVALSGAENDSPLGKVIRSELDSHFIASQDANVVFTHLPGDMGCHNVPVLQLDTEHGIGQRFNDCALHLNVFFFCHNKYWTLFSDPLGRVEWTRFSRERYDDAFLIIWQKFIHREPAFLSIK